MILVKTRISLDDLILKTLGTPLEILTIELLQDWVANLRFSDDFLDNPIGLGDRATRKLICQTPRFDLRRRELTSREFTIQPPLPRPALQCEPQHSGGDLVTVERHAIHQLANTSDKNLVILHVYAQPLKTIQVYCSALGLRSPLRVQYDNAV